MENGAFAPKEQCSIFHNIFINMIFQKALLWSNSLNLSGPDSVCHICFVNKVSHKVYIRITALELSIGDYEWIPG